MTLTPTGSDLTHRQVLLVFSGLMVGMLLAALDQTIVATALPTIVADLGGLEHLSWVVTSYLLAATASTPIYGKLGDLYGRKSVFLSAIGIFVVGSALSGLSRTMSELIAARAVQGLGAGGIMVTVQAIVADIVSPRERGRYMGLIGSVFAVSSIAGPLLGGFFTDSVLTWRAVFWINLPLGAIALGVIATVLHLPARRVQHQIDYPGAALLAASTTSLILALTWGGNRYAWGSPQILGLVVAGALLLVAFVFVEARAVEPVLPLRLFRCDIFNVTSAVGFIIGVAMFGAIVFLPIFLQVVNGVSPTQSGLQLLPMMVGIFTTSVGSGHLITRHGHYKRYPLAGTALIVVGMYLLSRMSADTPYAVAAAYMLVLGAGLGLVMQVLVLAVQNAVEPRDVGVATSASTFFRQIGGSFGVALFGTIFANGLAAELRSLPGAADFNLSAGSVTQSPEQLRLLPPAIHEGIVSAFTSSLHVVFLSAVPFAILAFALTFLLREVPLRQTTGTAEMLAEEFGKPAEPRA